MSQEGCNNVVNPLCDLKLQYLSEKIDNIDDNVKLLMEKIVGNGVPGIDKRLDRLEQDEKRRSIWLKAVITVSVGSIITSLVGAAPFVMKALTK